MALKYLMDENVTPIYATQLRIIISHQTDEAV